MANANNISAQSCPSGFVIPDDLGNPDNWFVNRTISNCSVPCFMTDYTHEEWSRLNIGRHVSNTLGIFFILLMLWAHRVMGDETRNQHHLVTLMAVLSLIFSLFDAAFMSISYNDRMCSSNSTMISASDGFTFCALTSIINVYFGFAMMFCWLAQALWVFMRVVVKHRKFQYNYQHVVCAILAAPLPAVIIIIASRTYGASRGSASCLFSMDVRNSVIPVYVVYGPLLILQVGGLLVMLLVIIKVGSVLICFRFPKVVPLDASTEEELSEELVELTNVVSNEANVRPFSTLSFNPITSTSPCRAVDEPEAVNIHVGPVIKKTSGSKVVVSSGWGIFKVFSVPIMFVLAFTAYNVNSLIDFAFYYSYGAAWADSYMDWAQCAVHNYNGIDETWHSVCGSHPHKRLPPDIKLTIVTFRHGAALITSLVYTNRIVEFLYAIIYYCCLGYSPLENVN